MYAKSEVFLSCNDEEQNMRKQFCLGTLNLLRLGQHALYYNPGELYVQVSPNYLLIYSMLKFTYFEKSVQANFIHLLNVTFSFFR